MPAGEFIEEHFIRPIIMHEGYNPINTFAYAVIAIACAYLIYRLFAGIKVAIDRGFMLRVVPYILLGSSMRVVTDSIDSGRMQGYEGLFRPIYDAVISSGAYDYGLITASPGIYVVVGLFAVITMYLSYKTKNFNLGSGIALALALGHLLLLAPMFMHIAYGIVIFAAAGGIAFAYWRVKRSSTVAMHWGVVLSQALDGSATFIALDVFNRIENGMYAEQHVLAGAIADAFGGSMLPFLLLKIALAIGVVWVLEKEKNANEANYIALLIIIFGLAPGLRNMLRIVAGT